MENRMNVVAEKKPLKTSRLKSGIKKCLLCKNLHLFLFVLIIPISSSYQRNISHIVDTNGTNNEIKLIEELNSKIETNSIKKFKSHVLLGEFYANRGFEPFWTVNFEPNEQSKDIINLLEEARNYGLNPAFFDIEKIKTLYASIKNETEVNKLLSTSIELELTLTDNSFRLLSYLRKGIIYTDSVNFNDEKNWFLQSLPYYLQTAQSSKNFTETLLKIQPANTEFEYLQKGLEKFLSNHTLKRNVVAIHSPETDSKKAHNSIKNLLIDLGYLQIENSNNVTAFTEALKKYQHANGITPSGTICRKTQAWLNYHTNEKYKTIVINLERIKRNLYEGNYYVMVNIPAYELNLVLNRNEKKVYKAVIGSPKTPTPVLSSRIEKIVTFPTWNVPVKIAKYELLSKIKKDPDFLKRNNYELYDKNLTPVNYTTIDWENVSSSDFEYTIIQNSSRYNALGIIKFIFPNIHHVFVHDTQSKNLFNSSYRAHSHGCIRLQNPDEFAARILFNDTDSIMVNKLEENLKKHKFEDINLNKPLNIHIRYFTCQANENGDLKMYKDIYKKDDVLKSRLFNNES